MQRLTSERGARARPPACGSQNLFVARTLEANTPPAPVLFPPRFADLGADSLDTVEILMVSI